MKKLTSLALGAGLALATISLAQAQTPSGAWKLSVGANDAPCTLTLAAGATSDAGTITAGQDCPGGLYTVTTWKTARNGIQLYNGDELVATLKSNGDSYVGTRFADGRKVALTR